VLDFAESIGYNDDTRR